MSGWPPRALLAVCCICSFRFISFPLLLSLRRHTSIVCVVVVVRCREEIFVCGGEKEEEEEDEEVERGGVGLCRRKVMVDKLW